MSLHSYSSGRYPWGSDEEYIKIKEKMEPERFWEMALKYAGYSTIEEYQKDIFSKYAVPIEDGALPGVTKQWARTLGWIYKEMEREAPRPTEMEMQVLAIMAMILVDADKHRLAYFKAANDMRIREIVDKYICRKD